LASVSSLRCSLVRGSAYVISARPRDTDETVADGYVAHATFQR